MSYVVFLWGPIEGDSEGCLEICGDIQVRALTTASEVALLTARAYLCTGQPREAQKTIVETLGTHATFDASLTAQMLRSLSGFARWATTGWGLSLGAPSGSVNHEVRYKRTALQVVATVRR